MPKNGWTAKTERLRQMSSEELGEMLGDYHQHISAKVARWVYENLAADNKDLRITAISRIGWDEEAPWINAYLWKELEKHKSTDFGDWVVIALCRPGAERLEDLERFAALYDDETAHPMTRGSAVFGLNNCAQLADIWEGEPCEGNPYEPRLRKICTRALHDENPYARAGACWLASRLGGFEKDLARLAEDHTPTGETGTVITVAQHAVD